MEVLKEMSGVKMSDSGTVPRGGITFCDPCEDEGRYFKAEGFCTDCDDYLCSGCLKVHRRPVLWRYHELLDKQNMPKMKLMNGVKDECMEPCAHHPKKILEYYCGTHDNLACSLCVFRNHRYCDNVDYIPDVADSISESEEYAVLNDKFACALKDIEILKKLTEQSLAVVDEIKRKSVTKITMLRLEICNFLDKLLEDITFVSDSDSTHLKACSNSFKNIAKRVKTYVTILEKKRKEMKMSQLFVEMKLSKLGLMDMMNEIEKTKGNCKVQHYEVDIDERNIMEMRKCLEKIWKINISVRSPINEENGDLATKDMKSIAVTDVGKTSSNENITEVSSSEMKTKIDQHVDDTTMCQTSEEELEVDVKTLDPDNARLFAECNPSGTEPGTTEEIEGQCSPASPSGVIQYSREFLLKQQTSCQALRRPVGILDIPDIVFDEPQDFYIRWMKAKTETKRQDMYIFRPSYVWGEWNAESKKETHSEEQSNGSVMPCVIQKPKIASKKKKRKKAVKTTTDMLKDPANEKASHDDSKITCKMKQKMYTLIVNEAQDVHSIIDWIESNLDESQKSGSTLAKLLMKNVCMFSCKKEDNGGWLFQPGKVHARKDLLVKYIGGNVDMQLEALYEVQIFVEKYKYPHGLLLEVLDVLNATGIISEDAFCKFDEGEKETQAAQKIPKKPKVKQMLYSLIVKERQDDRSIIDWIESNVDEAFKSGTAFVNSVVTTVCRFSSEKDDQGNWTLQPEKICEKKDLLLKYIGGIIDNELEALFAVQIFIEKFEQPPGILRETFYVLYGAHILSEDAFFKWETSTEKPDLREDCLKQTVPFFTWLLTKGQPK